MFSSAFTLAPLLVLILYIVEIRVDAAKLCYLTKRPFPVATNTIGIWNGII